MMRGSVGRLVVRTPRPAGHTSTLNGGPAVIRTLIVDDETLARVGLRCRLTAERDFDLVGEASDGPGAVESIRALQPDLVFLDVQLPECDGFQVLELVGSAHLPVVVFVTAYDQYALRAFDTHALDYLLKPVSDERFGAALNRVRDLLTDRNGAERTQARLANALESLEPTSARRVDAVLDPHGFMQRFVVRDRARFFFVKATDIDWFASASNYVQLHTGGHGYLIRMTMGELEEKLDPAQFARIHRSAIVNIDRVKEVRSHEHDEYAVVLRDGTVLRLGRTYRHRLLG
jgi:two-component system, LytTR family, response regulator